MIYCLSYQCSLWFFLISWSFERKLNLTRTFHEMKMLLQNWFLFSWRLFFCNLYPDDMLLNLNCYYSFLLFLWLFRSVLHWNCWKKSDYHFLLLSLDRDMICLTFMEYKGANAKHKYPQNCLPDVAYNPDDNASLQ